MACNKYAPLGVARIAAATLASEWGVTLGGYLGRSVHDVFEATGPRGEAAILKLAVPGSDYVVHEARALLMQAGRGTVRVLRADPRGLLVERVSPGTPLSRVVTEANDDQATDVVAEAASAWDLAVDHDPVLKQVSSLRTDLESVPEIFSRTPGLADSRFEELAEQACWLFDELVESAPTSVLVHGDLHHENLLLTTEGVYLAIDPHGLLGDPSYETAQMLLNPHCLVDHLNSRELAAVTRRRLGRLSRLLGADRDRLASWGFIKAVLSQTWSLKDEARYDVSFEVAKILAP
ncbi:MAG: aminoglycoside phosphotransferase family protein [Acidimicrobiales bacterium]